MNNFYASVEISNNILNLMVIKYFRLMKNEKEKQKPTNALALQYEKKYLEYFRLMNDSTFFEDEKKMNLFIKNHSIINL
jgi:hypothetical protein